MALNIKNSEVEQLVRQVARETGVSKTEAVRQALLEKKERLGLKSPAERWEELKPWFEEHVWAHIPPDQLGKMPSQEEQDEILGYGPDGF